MGKTRIIAETGAGQHGVATATVCARFGLPCVVYMGATDVERQKPNVFRMKLLGAEVVPVQSGQRHAEGRDERSAARLGDECRRHVLRASARRRARIPIRCMVRDFQSIIGKEARAQMQEAGRPSAGRAGRGDRRRVERDRPVPSVPRGSRVSAIDRRRGRRAWRRYAGMHAASLTGGQPGVLHGNRTYLLQDDDGQIIDGALDLGGARLSRHRAGARLAARDRPGDLSYATDNEALEAFQLCSQARGHHPGA